MDYENIPEQYRPLGAWAFFGLTILFSIPVVGFIFAIVFSFNNNQIVRRNFARSYFCVYAIVAIIAVIVIAVTAATGAGLAIFSQFTN